MKNNLTLFFTLIFVIAFSASLTVLLAIPLYYLDINTLHISETAYQTKAVLVKNFNVLMKYLLNPFDNNLRFPDFISSKNGLTHFKQVKKLIEFGFLTTILTFPFSIRFTRLKLGINYHYILILFKLLPVLLAIMSFFGGFTDIFIDFHKLIFPDNTWMFNPYKDPIINILPEDYFMHCFILFAVIYELVLYFLSPKNKSKKRT